MRRAFVIGHPIAQSRSPLLHGHWLRTLGIEGSYERIDVPPSDLPAFIAGLQDAGFAGGNVTVPHKQTVMPNLDHLDDAARAIGAVNTIWIEHGRLIGGNTDAAGFIAHLDDAAPNWQATTAVVLGAGGAARAAVHALRTRGVAVGIYNRTVPTAETLAMSMGASVVTDLKVALSRADLLVNTTSLGMIGKPPLDIDLAPMHQGAIIYDIVYAPLETGLLAQARARGLHAVDGLGMLLHQAVPGFTRWFGTVPTVTPELRDALLADLAK